jgi:hypothetical protein
MGKSASRGRAYDPPIQDFRKKTGNFHRSVGKTERTETANKAIARKQEFPIKQIILGLTAFGAACALLYIYLTWLLADDDVEEDVQVIA